jgi:Circularly permutated YpsA SLOG family
MFSRVISGGQTGADQVGSRAARAAGLETGGQMPAGFRTENGPRLEFAELYGVREMSRDDFQVRTEQNVRDADATLWFGSPDTSGGKTTLDMAASIGKPHRIIRPFREIKPSEIAEWLVAKRVKILNVAGNRHSKAPWLGTKVEKFLGDVFRRLGQPVDDAG